MNFLDKAIGALAPGWGASRLRSRMAIPRHMPELLRSTMIQNRAP